MVTRNRAGLASVLGLIGGASLVVGMSPAHAQAPSSDVFLLNTPCITVREAFSSAQGPTEMTGSGVFDVSAARITLPDGTERVFVAYDSTGQWRKNSAIVPRYAVVDLHKEGLRIVKKDEWLGSAAQDKDRLFMKPVITALPGDARSPGYFVLTGASEDNGTSGNPRTTMLVYDADGNPIVNVEGIGPGGERLAPRGERGIDLGAVAGRNNNQQQGASTIYFLGKDQGEYRLAMAFQENNQRAYIATYGLTIHSPDPDAPPPPPDAPVIGATVRSEQEAQLFQGEARHSRPTCAVPEGQNPSIILCASVHANEQPAEKGVTVARVSVVRGNLQVAGTADAIAPAPTAELKTPELKDGTFLVPQGYRFSQSILECADASCSAAALLTSHVMRGKRDGQNGHSPGTHATDILLVDRTSLAVHKAHVVGNWPHAHLTRLNYGAGAGTSALGVLSAPLTGMKPTTLQVMPVDGEGRDLAAPAPEHRYPVAAFTNQGDIVARGLNNPQNQGRGFLSAVTQVQNPGAEGGFMAGITSFTLVPTPTFGNGQHSFSGLDLCFVPATWGAQYTKTAPGSTIPWDKAPVGPPPDPANPNAPVGASPNVLEEGVAPTGSYAKKAGESCAMHASAGMGSNAPSYLALFGLFAAGAARARRGTRRRDGMGPFRTSGGPSCK